ncbi:GIY-YIG nuclease family protein [Actinomyces faecalis]|uniref:GIY-YIG nuclease family protein n=1 Tax=Actinomyces faecalis TaxID=2722820 RepID=UPI001F2F2BA5|nr:GIY-YIG nuclease family protein [Actinomyces faecalis]
MRRLFRTWSVETELHRYFADKRANRINTRREFFYATPAEVRDALAKITGNLLEITEEPKAEQYRLSVQLATDDAQTE